MRYSVEVCLLAATLATNTALTVGAQSAAMAQTMQLGISVELPITNNAVPMPAADREGSSVVSLTEQGEVYSGVSSIDAADLAQKLKEDLSSKTGKKLYIKADARAPYASLRKVLNAARGAGVEGPVLLTAQQVTSGQENPVPPQGLDVRVGSAVPSNLNSLVVYVLQAGQQRAALKINNQNISWDTMRNTPLQFFPAGKVIAVIADTRLPVARASS
jgi:biopolymer transport protein ExbD